MGKLRVALVFHHHQPLYVDPQGIFRFPWVFANAPRYAAHLAELEEHPGIRVTFNVQATLMEQWAQSGEGFRLLGSNGGPRDHGRSSPEAEASRRLLAGYRDLALHHRCEFLASPYYHPILPLLASRGMGRDLAWHLREGRRAAEHFLGVRPQGLWVPEMAFGMEVLPFLRPAGARYTVLEGELLGSRKGHPHRPYALGSARELTVFLRHTAISNGIAFGWGRDPEGSRGAEACLRRLRRSCRGMPLVVLALDGENWMKGRGFLHHLYRGLEGAGDLQAVTLRELAEEFEPHPLETFPAGSWGRNRDLSTWVGSPAKDRLWAAIEGTRRRLLGARSGAPPEAWRWLYAAEGSDYTYWDTVEEGPFVRLAHAFLQRAFELAGVGGP